MMSKQHDVTPPSSSVIQHWDWSGYNWTIADIAAISEEAIRQHGFSSTSKFSIFQDHEGRTVFRLTR